MMRKWYLLLLLIVFIPSGVFSQQTWQGNAAVVRKGTFDFSGIFAASNSFNNNAVILVQNLENEKKIQVTIKGRIKDDEGVFLLLSEDSARALEMDFSEVVTVTVELIDEGDKEQSPFTDPLSVSLEDDLPYIADVDNIGESLDGENTEVARSETGTGESLDGENTEVARSETGTGESLDGENTEVARSETGTGGSLDGENTEVARSETETGGSLDGENTEVARSETGITGEGTLGVSPGFYFAPFITPREREPQKALYKVPGEGGRFSLSEYPGTEQKVEDNSYTLTEAVPPGKKPVSPGESSLDTPVYLVQAESSFPGSPDLPRVSAENGVLVTGPEASSSLPRAAEGTHLAFYPELPGVPEAEEQESPDPATLVPRAAYTAVLLGAPNEPLPPEKKLPEAPDESAPYPGIPESTYLAYTPPEPVLPSREAPDLPDPAQVLPRAGAEALLTYAPGEPDPPEIRENDLPEAESPLFSEKEDIEVVYAPGEPEPPEARGVPETEDTLLAGETDIEVAYAPGEPEIPPDPGQPDVSGPLVPKDKEPEAVYHPELPPVSAQPEKVAVNQPDQEKTEEAEKPEKAVVNQPDQEKPEEEKVYLVQADSRPPRSTSSSTPESFSLFNIRTLAARSYFIQLGAYLDETMAFHLRSRFVSVYPVEVYLQEGPREIYKVLLGPLNKEESDTLLYRFHSEGFKDAFVRYIK